MKSGGNNIIRQKNQMEDRLIKGIDAARTMDENKFKASSGRLKVPIIELIAYKAAVTGRPVSAVGV